VDDLHSILGVSEDDGDYETALREFRPLAEQGHAEAQLNLGIMYSLGLGVPKDHVQAYVWYTLAAPKPFGEIHDPGSTCRSPTPG